MSGAALVALVALVALAGAAAGDDDGSAAGGGPATSAQALELEAAERHVGALEYREALARLRALLAAPDGLDDEQQLRAHAALARVAAVLGDVPLATAHFAWVLRRSPSFVLDRRESPKVREALALARDELAREAPLPPTATPAAPPATAPPATAPPATAPPATATAAQPEEAATAAPAPVRLDGGPAAPAASPEGASAWVWAGAIAAGVAVAAVGVGLFAWAAQPSLGYERIP